MAESCISIEGFSKPTRQLPVFWSVQGRLQPPAPAQRDQNTGCCSGVLSWLTATTCAIARKVQVDLLNTQRTVVPLNGIQTSIGKEVSTTGKVYSSKDIGIMVLVNLGGAYPNQLLTVVLKGDAKQLATQITDKTITVQGTVIGFKGKPEIVVTEVSDLTINK